MHIAFQQYMHLAYLIYIYQKHPYAMTKEAPLPPCGARGQGRQRLSPMALSGQFTFRLAIVHQRDSDSLGGPI